MTCTWSTNVALLSRVMYSGLLQMSIKITNEAPAGIMLGVRNTYTWLNQDMLDSVTDPKWKTMLFALAFMHTIVQERRKFGPLGWNIRYEFNDSDLECSTEVLFNMLELGGEVPPEARCSWKAIEFLSRW